MKYPKYVKTALGRLADGGFEAYLVGGCVRDFLMGTPPHDFDIATNALPEQVRAAFGDFKIALRGLKHGTVTVIIDGRPCEITTFRAEGGYSDRRRPDSVIFGVSLTEDLRRRDFTINALAYGESEGIIDPFGGAADIKAGLIRCVGDPEERFNEDALRIMRALRFAARLSFDIEEQTAAAIRRLYRLLGDIAAERITDELCAILSAGRPGRLVSEYAELFSFIFKGADIERLKSAAGPLDDCPGYPSRLALIAHLCQSPDIYKGLTLTKQDRQTAGLLYQYLSLPVPQTRVQARRLMRLAGAENMGLLLSIWAALGIDCEQAALFYERILTDGDCCAIGQLAISGNDLKGLFEGRHIGRVLNGLLDAVIEDILPNERQALLDCAKDKFASLLL